MLVIKDLKPSPAPGGGMYVPHGGYTPKFGWIEMVLRDVEEFEAGKGLRHTKKGQLVFFVGVTLLHELTHWLRHEAGLPKESDDEDRGNDFETEIYGAPLR